MSKIVQEMFKKISSRYDLTNDVLSLGIHRHWRKLIRKQAQLNLNDRALDICTGTGDVAIELETRFPGQICAIDFVEEMLRLGKQKSPAIPFFLGDAMVLPFKKETFGLATISFGIRNLDSPLEGLKEIYRILKPGSQLFVLEFGQPKSRYVSVFYNFYSAHLIPFLGGMLTGSRKAYEYLPKTSASFPCRESFVKLMHESGFRNSSFKSLSFGIAYLYEGTK